MQAVTDPKLLEQLNSDAVTDPELLAQLEGEDTVNISTDTAINDPELLRQLESEESGESETRLNTAVQGIWEQAKVLFPPLGLASKANEAMKDWQRPIGGKDLPVADVAIKTVKNVLGHTKDNLKRQSEEPPKSALDLAVRGNKEFWKKQEKMWTEKMNESDFLKLPYSVMAAIASTGNTLSPDTLYSPAEKITGILESITPANEVELARDIFTAKTSSMSSIANKTAKAVKKESKIMAAIDDKFPEFAKKRNEFVTAFKERIDNNYQRIIDLEKKSGMEIEQLPSEVKKSMPGRISTSLENVEKEISKLSQDIYDTAKSLKLKREDFEKDVFEYLINKRVPEFNAKLGEGKAGRTTQEAFEGLAKIESSPNFEKIKEVADKLKRYNDETLDIAYADGQPWGIISKDTLDLLREENPNHIPFQRILGEDENYIQSLTTKGLDVKSSGLKRAKGSSLQIDDILNNIYANRTQTIQRIEKNKVNNALYDFAEKFQQEFPEQTVLKTGTPKVIGKTSDNKPLFEKLDDYKTLQFERFGKPTYVEFTDPKIAIAAKDINKQKLPGIFRLSTNILRWMAHSHTGANPEFGITNKIRDVQDDILYMAKEGISQEKIAKSGLKDISSMKAIRDYQKGIKTTDSELYRKFKESGWTTGGLGMSTKEQTAKKLSNIRREIENKPYAAVNKILQMVDDYNQVIEDSSRFTVFKTALEDGYAWDKAGALSKTAGLDFNEMGTWGSVINSLYMFSNASIRAAKRSIEIMTDPKIAAETALGLGTAIGVIDNHNKSIDPDYEMRISKWDRFSGINILLPDNPFVDYITIPLSPTLRPMKVALENGYKFINSDKIDVEEAAENIGLALVQGLNPIGGTEIDAVIPSQLKPLQDIRSNRTWSGQKMYPEKSKFTPASIKYYPDLKKTEIGGGVLIPAAKYISDKTGHRIEINPTAVNYALEQYMGGRIAFPKKVINTATSLAKGEMPNVKEIPFASKILRKSPPNAVFTPEETKFISKESTEKERTDFYNDEKFSELLQQYTENKDMTSLNEFINQQDLDERSKYYIDIMNSMVRTELPNRKFYEALKQLPKEIQMNILENRLSNSTPEIKQQILKTAAIMGILTDKYFMKINKRKSIGGE